MLFLYRRVHLCFTTLGRKLSQNRTELFHSMPRPTSVSARVQYTINIDNKPLLLCVF
jgi:hypothetical protein